MPIRIFNVLTLDDLRLSGGQRYQTCGTFNIKLPLKSSYPLQCPVRLDLFNDNRRYRHNWWKKLPTVFAFRYS